MRTAVVLGFLCLLAAAPVFSADVTPPAPAPATGTTPTTTTTPANTKPDFSLPKDASAQWQIGITVFSSSGLSSDNAYLTYSLPLQLRDEVSGFSVHSYRQEERDDARRALISREIALSQKNITSVWKERDALLFDRTQEGAPARVSVAKRLAAAIARRDFLETLTPSDITFADQKPIVIKEGTGAGKLLQLPMLPPEIFCAQQGIDLLVGGTIQEVQGYLLLDLWAFDSLSKSRIFETRNAATREELSASLKAFGREIAATILGRPWSLVAFTPDPPGTALYVDGVLAASGASPSLYLAPGTHAVRLSAAGYRDVTRSMELEAGKESIVDDKLSKIAEGKVLVSSDPTGADLYVDSTWTGVTPLEVDRPPIRSRGVLTWPGFYDMNFPLDPDSPATLSFSLQKDQGKLDELQKKARDDFYGSLGVFALSVPLPLFSYALAFDFAMRTVSYNNQGMGAAAEQAQATSNVFLGTYYAGIVVSVSLFVWMVTRIVHYVGVANEIARLSFRPRLAR